MKALLKTFAAGVIILGIVSVAYAIVYYKHVSGKPKHLGVRGHEQHHVLRSQTL